MFNSWSRGEAIISRDVPIMHRREEYVSLMAQR
jgi:hypothetical protein